MSSTSWKRNFCFWPTILIHRSLKSSRCSPQTCGGEHRTSNRMGSFWPICTASTTTSTANGRFYCALQDEAIWWQCSFPRSPSRDPIKRFRSNFSTDAEAIFNYLVSRPPAAACSPRPNESTQRMCVRNPEMTLMARGATIRQPARPTSVTAVRWS